VPTGIKIFNWIGTMWGGRVRWTAAMLFAIGFVITFLLGGLTGIYLASPPLDFFTHDTYFVVAHFHSVVLALVMGGMAGIYYWWPKITGYLLNERIGKWQFWTFFIGANLMVMPQYQLGLLGMPRRVATYIQAPEWQTLNRWATAGAFLMGISTIFFLANVVYSSYKRVEAGDNPWDAQTLEWFTTSPPPHHNYYALPPIRSERPTWDYNHPEAPALAHGHDEQPQHEELVPT
jgi:cytochrome c oxidase subunit I